MKRSLEKVLHDKVTEFFSKIAAPSIISVKMKEDYDSAGERVLLVSVVFDGDTKHLDAKKLLSIVRTIRPALLACGEEAFPVFSFVSAQDETNMTHAA
jgi:hypothetical protein